MMAGADFIKTSTGKEPVNATLPVSLVMVRAIRDYHERTGFKVGFKPAGGIRSAKQALDWLLLMKEELGDEWLDARPVPHRRERAAHRHRAPARALRHRPLLGRAPSPDGLRLTDDSPSRRSSRHGLGPRARSRRARARVARRATSDASATSSTAPSAPPASDTFDVINPANRPDAGAGRAGRRRGRRRRGQGRAQRACPRWQALAGHERARYLYALARQVQKHARLFAVLETLDNGKPIRETRDIDIPLVARHFYHHAGWAQLHGRRVRRATRRWASSARSSRGTSRC